MKLKEIDKILHPNILILDEPKQQNLDNDSLVNCIDLISNISSLDAQIILTTYSELPKDREKFKEYIIYEMKNKKDYLLKQLSNR